MAAAGELTAGEKEEAAERRLAEIEFIKSAFSADEAHVVEEDACSVVLRHLRLPSSEDNASGDDAVVKVDLSLRMPKSYPVRESATLIVNASLSSCPTNPPFVRKATLHAIPKLIETCQRTAVKLSESQGGGETVLSVLTHAEEWVSSEWKDIREEYSQHCIVNTKSSHAPTESKNCNDTNTLGRRIIYSHHIIANSKRRGLQDLASQYKLGGYAKIGWPGVILIEGCETNCQAFVNDIKQWRWQQLQVRDEEQKLIPEGGDIDTHRQLPLQFEEVGEDGMSLLANNCRKYGLERMFLSCMKINDHRTMDEKEQTTDETNNLYGILVNVDHMNDGKRYRKWLKKTCQTQGCNLFVRQCRPTDNAATDGDRPAIYVGVFGDKASVKQVMKMWRTSRVDVDSKGKPCLERMIHVLAEGDVADITSLPLDGEECVDCTRQELNSFVANINEGWVKYLKEADYY